MPGPYPYGTAVRVSGILRRLDHQTGKLIPATGETALARFKPPSGAAFDVPASEVAGTPGRYAAVITRPAVGAWQWFLYSTSNTEASMDPPRTFAIKPRAF